MNKETVLKIFKKLSKEIPDPVTELNYINHYTLLVAIILSAQATDIGVNKATKSLFEKIDNPKSMIELGEDGLKKFIKTIGLFNSKSKNIIAMSNILIDKFFGKVPENFEDLINLPGVGRKTANVFLNCALGEPRIAVDTHVYRVSRRLGLSKAETHDKVENDLNRKVPKEFKKEAHHYLILHGRYICKARKPDCNKCYLTNECKFFKKLK